MVAWLSIGRQIVYGTNGNRSSTQFKRLYKGSSDYEAHAEMACVKEAEKKGNIKGATLHVMRFLANGSPSCSKPCIHCQRFLKRKGIKKVYYTNWNGEWENMIL